MKCANVYTCMRFDEQLRAFIDDELPVNEKEAFLGHASTCPNCSRALDEQQRLRQTLRGLPNPVVSATFDFTLLNRIRREQQRLANPFYAFQVRLAYHLPRFVVPFAAVLLLVGAPTVWYINGGINGSMIQSTALSNLDNREGVELTTPTDYLTVDEERYILETVDVVDAEQGVFRDSYAGSLDRAPSEPILTLVSF